MLDGTTCTALHTAAATYEGVLLQSNRNPVVDWHGNRHQRIREFWQARVDQCAAKSAIELVRILCDGLTGTWRSTNPCSSWAECDRWEMPVFGSHQLTGRSHCFALGSGSFSFLYGAHIRLYSSAQSRSNFNDRAFVRGGTTESQSPLRSVCYLAVLSDFRRFRRPGAGHAGAAGGSRKSGGGECASRVCA